MSAILDPNIVERPWGTFMVLEENASFKIKRIEVNPNASLSLQLHHRRSEHWVVVSGEAKVFNDNHEFTIIANQSTYIPVGNKHRLSNPSPSEKLVIIEVQCGSYLGEDDIIRLEDEYGRPVNYNQDDKLPYVRDKKIFSIKGTFKHLLESTISFYPFKIIKGLISAFVAYPLAERLEKRQISPKLEELRAYYKKPFDERAEIAKTRLINILLFAGENVPYYKELYKKHNFDPNKINKDIRYLESLPFLTKEIIREQKDRLLSKSLNDIKHYIVKTGGSTGPSCTLFYDQNAYDYSAAITLYGRESVGKHKWKDAIHFACRFPNEPKPKFPSREDYKCFAMNRSNIFFDRLDNYGLNNILEKLKQKRPYLLHAHPSTIYALACYAENKKGVEDLFKVFESSGEVMTGYMQEKIEKVFKCKAINRYGLAEFGIIGYELDLTSKRIKVLDSEGWLETRTIGAHQHELIFTGFRNFLMPLIRYTVGDEVKIEKDKDGLYLNNVIGRVHDLIPINGINYPTHHIMDILDHRVGGIQEFQIEMRHNPPILRLAIEPTSNQEEISMNIKKYWPNEFILEFVDQSQFIRVGNQSKFRHVVR
jgi:phenylacetate-CoA ligase